MKPERALASSGQEAGVLEPVGPRAGVALINPQSVHLISGRNLSPAGRRGCDSAPAPSLLWGPDTMEAYGEMNPPASKAMEAERPRPAQKPGHREDQAMSALVLGHRQV